MAVAAPNPVPILFLTPLGRARRAGGFPGKSWISCGKTQQGDTISWEVNSPSGLVS